MMNSPRACVKECFSVNRTWILQQISNMSQCINDDSLYYDKE